MRNGGVSPRIFNGGTLPKNVVSFMLLALYPFSFTATLSSVLFVSWVGPEKMSAPAGSWGRIPGRLSREYITIQLVRFQFLAVFSLLLRCPLKFVWTASGYATDHSGRVGSTLDCILEVPGSNVISESSKSDCLFSCFSVFSQKNSENKASE